MHTKAKVRFVLIQSSRTPIMHILKIVQRKQAEVSGMSEKTKEFSFLLPLKENSRRFIIFLFAPHILSETMQV